MNSQIAPMTSPDHGLRLPTLSSLNNALPHSSISTRLAPSTAVRYPKTRLPQGSSRARLDPAKQQQRLALPDLNL